jgi:Transmembrane domain of unknown function (DUF3566)
MDGGHVIPPVESERPTRIIPPLPTPTEPPAEAKVPLKERFQKVLATVGASSVASSGGNRVAGAAPTAPAAPAAAPHRALPNNLAPNVSPHGINSNGAANGVVVATGAAAVASTQPIARQAQPAAPANPAPPVAARPATTKRPKPQRAARPAARTAAPAPARTVTAEPGKQPRRARLRLTRVDPWSVMKTAFLLSVAFGIVTVVAVLIVWSVLGSAGVWDSVNETVKGVVGDTATNSFDIEDYVGMDRVIGFTALVAVIDVVLLTTIATLSAFLYNMAAALLGGLEVTLVEDH